MANKVSFAVIGVGRMGSKHARNLSRGRVKGARLVGIADVDRQALQSVRSKCRGVHAFKDYRQMINTVQPQVVVIATPHYAHVPIAEYCIAKGCHVVIEKPVAVTTAQAEHLNRLIADNPDLKIAVMYNQRTNPVYRKAKQILSEGKLGAVQRINFIVTDWYRSDAYYRQNSWRASYREEGGGILINQCVHQLDILQWLVGMPAAIEGKITTKNRSITAENDVTALLRYADGVYCTLSASGHELHGTNRIEIAGEKGRLVLGKYSMKWISLPIAEPEFNKTTRHEYGVVSRKVYRYRYGLQLIRDALFGQQRNILQNMADVVRKGGDLIAPASEGIHALGLLNGIYLSAWEGKEIPYPFPSRDYEAALSTKIAAEAKKEE